MGSFGGADEKCENEQVWHFDNACLILKKICLLCLLSQFSQLLYFLTANNKITNQINMIKHNAPLCSATESSRKTS